MKAKYNFYNPLLMALMAACCLWIVTDMAYGVRVWELSVADWMKRFEALVVLLISFIALYLFFNFQVKLFLDKDQGHKPAPKAVEYLLVILFTIILLNISLYVVITFVNASTYRWGEGVLVNMTAIPISLLYYTIIRNNILAARYTEKKVQLEQMKVDRLETELKLLRSQYHPHFLFNALNTVYFQIDEKNEAAIESIDLLSGLLRYQLYDIQTKVNIEQEIDYLQTYIRFQKLRMTERLQFHFCFSPELKDQKIHPLLFQPLLENAFKYVGGDYRIWVSLQKEESKVRFVAKNSITTDTLAKKETAGIGIENLKKRLGLLYPDKHKLHITQDDGYFTVELLIDLSE